MSYPEILRSDETRAFWSHMEVLCARARPPRSSDMELMEIYHLAPYIALVDLEQPDGRMRVRYVGTRIVELFDQETTGQFLDDVDIGPHTEALIGMYRSAFSEVRPYWGLAEVEMTRDEGYGYTRLITFGCERLMFPMVDRDGIVTRLAVILVRHAPKSIEGGFTCEALEFPEVEMPVDAAASRA